MNWIQGIPGLDCRDQPENLVFANRLVALACAARLKPVTVSGNRIDATPVGKAA